MPELNIGFALLPTEKDLFAAHKGREIDQPPFNVLELDFSPLKFSQNLLKSDHGPDPTADTVPAQINAAPEHRLELAVQTSHLCSEV